MPPIIKINQRELMLQLGNQEQVFRRVFDAETRDNVFLPAVEQMKEKFEDSDITLEIDGGIGASNQSHTLPGVKGEGANLTGFIGFEQGSNPTEEIRKRLDPAHPDGPKLERTGVDKKNLVFQYKISGPNEKAIYANTPIPWAPGLSWAKRMEIGIAGLGKFLNKEMGEPSRSGAGIQIKNQLRGGQFKPRSYLSDIFKNFFEMASGKKYNTIKRSGQLKIK